MVRQKLSKKNLKYYQYQRSKSGKALLSKPLQLKKHFSAKQCRSFLKSKILSNKQKKVLHDRVNILTTRLLKSKISCGKQKKFLQDRLDAIELKNLKNKERKSRAVVKRAENKKYMEDFKLFHHLKDIGKIPKQLLFHQFLSKSALHAPRRAVNKSPLKTKTKTTNVLNIQHLVKRRK
jgi:hypothetical protein